MHAWMHIERFLSTFPTMPNPCYTQWRCIAENISHFHIDLCQKHISSHNHCFLMRFLVRAAMLSIEAGKSMHKIWAQLNYKIIHFWKWQHSCTIVYYNNVSVMHQAWYSIVNVIVYEAHMQLHESPWLVTYLYTQEATLTRVAVKGSQLWAVASRILASTPPVAVVALTTAVVVRGQLRTQLVTKVGVAGRLGRTALCDALPISPPACTRDIITAWIMCTLIMPHTTSWFSSCTYAVAKWKWNLQAWYSEEGLCIEAGVEILQGRALHIWILALLSALTGVVVQILIVTTAPVALTLAWGGIQVESRWTVSIGALTAASVCVKVHSLRATVVVVALTATWGPAEILIITAIVQLDTVTTTGHWVERRTIVIACTGSGLIKPSCLSPQMRAFAFTGVRVLIQWPIAVVGALTGTGVRVKPLIPIAVHTSTVARDRSGAGWRRECCWSRRYVFCSGCWSNWGWWCR